MIYEEVADTTPIKQLKKYSIRLTTVLNELDVLDDEKDFKYSELVETLGDLTKMLELRREILQRKGKTQ